jgi:beta-galactosidase
MKRRIQIIAIFLLALSQVAHAQQYKNRLIIGWQFHKGDLGGIWEAVRDLGESTPESIPSWDEIELPHCFNSEDAVDPDQSYYQGAGWYRTLIEIKNPYPGGRTLLHFEGAGQKTKVYVHTAEAGAHVGGYDEWTIDITEQIAEFKKSESFAAKFHGKIPIIIRCDNSRDLEMIPSDLSDFTIYGGMYRYLNLVYVPSLSIDRIQVSSQVNEKGTALIDVKTLFYNPDKVRNADVEIHLVAPDGKVIAGHKSTIAQVGSNIEWRPVIKKPVLWSPLQPQLYTIEVTINSSTGTHKHEEKIGIRDFHFEEQGPFFLNGKRLLLQGTHRHEDHAGVGNAMTEDMMRKEMIMMKDMGVNFIRLGHYQQSRIILNLCDSLGILVWEEIPWCRGGLGNETYKQQARDMLTNMIQQHYNHPSVIIWGLGNENDWPGDFEEFDKEKIRAFMKDLNALSHKLDPSRKTAIRRCDFCKDIVDVYSPSIWAGWYRGRYTEYKRVSEEEVKSVRHFLHVEWGGDSHARRHSESPEAILAKVNTGNGVDERNGDASLAGGNVRVSKDGDWSETYICNLIDWHLKEQETMPWLTGTAYWPFKDFSTPVRPENPVPYVNQKGVIERDFTIKSPYYVFQSYWTAEPMVHIYGHTWPVRWGKRGEHRMVKVYSNCDEVELLVNGKTYGVKKRNAQDFPAAGLRWMVPLNEGSNTFRAIAKKEGAIIEDQLIQDYQTAEWHDPAKLVVEQIDERNDMVTVQVKILDEANVPCLDAANWIHFSLAGDGFLMDNQGTSSGSRKVQAYNGRAVIKVKQNGGKNIICVQSPSLPTVFLSLGKNSIASTSGESK